MIDVARPAVETDGLTWRSDPAEPKTTEEPSRRSSMSDDKRRNIPTAEHQSVLAGAREEPRRRCATRATPDLDPQLVWRGKD